jgi:hypothetical protein
LSLASLQALFEDMLFSEQVTRRVFSADGARYASVRGITSREHALLVSVDATAYARARTVTTSDLRALFPATEVVLRAADVDVDAVYGGFFDAPEGHDHDSPSRPDALAAYLRRDPRCAPVWSPAVAALLAWECALVRAHAGPAAGSGLRLAAGVQIREERWDMPAWVRVICDAGAWVPPVGEPSWYALQPRRLPGLGGRATVWNLGPVLGALLLDIARGEAVSDDAPLATLLLEHARSLGLIAPVDDGPAASSRAHDLRPAPGPGSIPQEEKA